MKEQVGTTTQPLSSSLTFVACRGLRYAAPYNAVTSPTFLKESYVGQSLATALGQMYRRQRGTQPLEESVAFWQAELQAGRVEWRHCKQSRDDPWTWHSVNNKDNANTNDNNNNNNNNDNKDATNITVSRGMSIRIHQHVHEKVVPDVSGPIPILYENERCLAVYKPAGLATVDETGGTGINSLLTIVQQQQQQQQQFSTTSTSNNARNVPIVTKITPAHRLDKPVSGVLLIGKSPSQASKLLQTIQTDSNIQKTYIARCCRKLSPSSSSSSGSSSNNNNKNSETLLPPPLEPFSVCMDLTWDAQHRRSVPCTTQQSRQKERDRAIHRAGQAARLEKKRASRVMRGHDNDTTITTAAKTTTTTTATTTTTNTTTTATATTKHTTHTTIFCRLGEPLSDGNILIQCQPQTGYRHQIRAHLAEIGWPIANDVTYGGSNSRSSVGEAQHDLLAYVDDEKGTLRAFLLDSNFVRDWCPKCQWIQHVLQNCNKDTDSHEYDFKPITVEQGIWLHSYRYVLPSRNMNVVAPLPEWAKDATPFLNDKNETTDMLPKMQLEIKKEVNQ